MLFRVVEEQVLLRPPPTVGCRRGTGLSSPTVPDLITLTDNRTGESVEIPIVNGGVDADVRGASSSRTWFYDPGFMTTASCSSAITELDGDAGILRYRGYPIEELAEHSTYLEVAYLLCTASSPTAEQYERWRHEITYHTFIHENMRKRFMEGFHYDAHPMGMLVSASPPSAPSTSTPRTSTTPTSATSRSSASSPRCRRSRPAPTASARACPSSGPTTRWTSRPTSSG